MLLTTENQQCDEWNSHTRGAQIAVWLKDGAKLSTEELAERVYVTTQGIDYIMVWLVRRFPIEKYDGKWQWMDKGV